MNKKIYLMNYYFPFYKSDREKNILFNWFYYLISSFSNLYPIMYKNKQTRTTIKESINGSIKHKSFDFAENMSKELIILFFIYIYFMRVKKYFTT